MIIAVGVHVYCISLSFKLIGTVNDVEKGHKKHRLSYLCEENPSMVHLERKPHCANAKPDSENMQCRTKAPLPFICDGL